jgi:hypothetical protein
VSMIILSRFRLPIVVSKGRFLSIASGFMSARNCDGSLRLTGVVAKSGMLSRRVVLI